MNSGSSARPRKKSLTVHYSLVQAAYWMNYSVSLGFAAVYLQALGYNNTQLGGIIAAGHLLSTLLGPWLASCIDRSDRVTAKKLAPLLLAFQTAALIILLFYPVKGLLTTVLYSVYICLSTTDNTLNLKLYTDASYSGIPLDYGFARGIGSLAYVLSSVVLGILAESSPIRIPPLAGLLMTAFQLTAFLFIAGKVPDTAAVRDVPKGVTLPEFFRKNRRFCLHLLGMVLIYCAHLAIFSFLINIARNAGGSTRDMGFLTGYAAAVEIPVMLLFTRLFGKKDFGRLLRFSIVFFVFESAAIAAASNLTGLYLAFLLQAPAFALYTAASVPYVEKAISFEDSAKAQSLTYTTTALGSVLASLICGRLFDLLSVPATLWIATGICLIGALIAFFGIETGKKD